MKNLTVIKIYGLPLRIAILLFPAVVIFCFYVLRESNYDYYTFLVIEDSLVEYLTFAMYLISSIIASRISISFFKLKNTFFGISYVFLACGMFFISGEEISWGQRILNVSVPQFFLENSSQNEINIHNLKPIESIVRKIYVFIGLYGAFLWILFLKMKQYNLLINPYFIPKWYLASYYFPVFLFYAYFDFTIDHNHLLGFSWNDEEPVELILSMGFFLFISINRCRQIQEFNLPEPKCLTSTST